MDLNEARLRWADAQGLLTARAEPLERTLARTGWVRTLGGAAGYLALSARNPSASPSAVQVALSERRIVVAPSVRGCIYLLPAEDLPLALSLARHLSAKRDTRDRERAGVRPDELASAGDAILRCLDAEGPATTPQLRAKLPEGSIRSLGDTGRKLGLSSTLPVALRDLELRGRVVRVPVDARLDHEQYVWHPADIGVPAWSPALALELTRRFLRWAGPTSRPDLARWTGLKASEARAALESSGAVVRTLDGHPYVCAPDVDTPVPTGVARLLPGMDALYALRTDTSPLVDPSHHDVPIRSFSTRGDATLAQMGQPIERTIVVDGQVVGLWAWHPRTQRVVTSSPFPLELDAEIDRVTQQIAAIGHGRVFSMDRDEQLTERAERVASLRWPPGGA